MIQAQSLVKNIQVEAHFYKKKVNLKNIIFLSFKKYTIRDLGIGRKIPLLLQKKLVVNNVTFLHYN